MRKTIQVSLFVVLAIAIVVGTAYAVSYTGDYFQATGAATTTNCAELSLHTLHFTNNGNDTIDFKGSNGSTEQITFGGSNENAYIKYTATNGSAKDKVEVRAHSGDVIITLGQ